MEFGTFLLLQSPVGRAAPRSSTSAAWRSRRPPRSWASTTCGWPSTTSRATAISRPLTYALHLANKTRRIRVGTAVIVVPLHHPLVIAEEIATVDLLSGGRLDVGLGRGYQRYEFERLGQDLAESRSRWEEAVDIILLGFSGKTFSYDGKYYKIPETTVFPLPVQKPTRPSG